MTSVPPEQRARRYRAGAVRGTYAYMGPRAGARPPARQARRRVRGRVILYVTDRRACSWHGRARMTQIVERYVAPPSSLFANYPRRSSDRARGLSRDRASARRSPRIWLSRSISSAFAASVTGPLMISHDIRRCSVRARALRGHVYARSRTGRPACAPESPRITSTGNHRRRRRLKRWKAPAARGASALARQRTAVGIASPSDSAPATRSAPAQSSLVPPPVRSIAPGAAHAAYELTVDDLIEDERVTQTDSGDDHLGLDRFDEDEEVAGVFSRQGNRAKRPRPKARHERPRARLREEPT